KILCHLESWRHGYRAWQRGWTFAPNKRVSLRLIVGDGRQMLFHDEEPILSLDWAWPTDCCLAIISETWDSAVIHRCSLRPLTERDLTVCGWTTPPTDLATNIAEEAVRATTSAGESRGVKPNVPLGHNEAALRWAKISEGYPALPKHRERFVV